jgi:hypothetical protein
VTRICGSCGDGFTPSAPHHRLCWTCWRKERDEATLDEQYQSGFADGLKAAMRSSLRRGTELDANVLRDAITLCHPDQHPDAPDTAHRVTRALLEQWNAERRAAA